MGSNERITLEQVSLEQDRCYRSFWKKWVETNNGATGPESTGRGYGAKVETPPEDSDDDEARESGRGVDGS
jgi:hypothetical protein